MNFSLIYDNNAALEFVKEYQPKVEVPTLYDINNLISQYYNCFSTDSGEVDIKGFATHMVPVKSLKFLTVSSLLDPKHLMYQRSKEIMYRPMINVDHRHGRFLSLAINFRGNISDNDVKKVYEFPEKFSSYFCTTFNDKFKINFNKRPAVCYGEVQEDLIGATVIGNGTSTQQNLIKICEIFTSVFRRKAFIHHYIAEGLDEMEFTECESMINDLISGYQSAQDNQ